MAGVCLLFLISLGLTACEQDGSKGSQLDAGPVTDFQVPPESDVLFERDSCLSSCQRDAATSCDHSCPWPSDENVQCTPVCDGEGANSCDCSEANWGAYADLMACAPTIGCDTELERIEGDEINILADLTCLLEGLQNRTPGLYRHVTHDSHSQGADTREHLLWIRADGKVEYIYRFGLEANPMECTLKDAGYFQYCLDGFNLIETDQLGLVNLCLYGKFYPNNGESDWFTDCTPKAPTCD